MDLNITTTERQGAVVWNMSGKIVLGDESDGLRAQLNQMLTASTGVSERRIRRAPG